MACRQAYLPAMYNNLDISNVSASSNAFSPISSSSSQSLKDPARFKAPTPSVRGLESLTVADSQPPPFSPKAVNVTASTSSGCAILQHPYDIFSICSVSFWRIFSDVE